MPEAAPKYLTVTGVLLPDNRLLLQPGFTVTQSEFAHEDPNSRLFVALADDADRVLLRYGLPVMRPCIDGRATSHFLVLAKVPLPQGTQSIRFVRDGAEIHRINVARNPPEVRITWDPGDGVDGVQAVTWEADHPDGRDLHYIVSYAARDGEALQPLTPPLRERGFELDLPRLPGGERCRVGVLATDGVNTVLAESRPFRVPVRPCQAMILEPEDGAEFTVGEPVAFRGQGYYLEERQPEFDQLTWLSSIDGQIGRGSLIRVPLASGEHEITLAAGGGDRIGRMNIRIGVRR